MSDPKKVVPYHVLVASGILSAIAVVLVALFVSQPLTRAVLVLVAVAPAFVTNLRFVLVVNPSLQMKRRKRERRQNYTLRGITSQFLVDVRNLNRLKVIAQSDPNIERIEEMEEEIISDMHSLVDRILTVAGQGSSVPMNGAGPDVEAKVDRLASEANPN